MKKSATEGDRLLRLFSRLLSTSNGTYYVFEVQLCIEISIFKEKHVFYKPQIGLLNVLSGPRTPRPKGALFSVLVFGPEWVSYERSRGIRRWVLREISARVFL